MGVRYKVPIPYTRNSHWRKRIPKVGFGNELKDKLVSRNHNEQWLIHLVLSAWDVYNACFGYVFFIDFK